MHSVYIRKELTECLKKLRADANANAVVLLSADGIELASCGHDTDAEGYARAAILGDSSFESDRWFKGLGKDDFALLFLAGCELNLHISVVANLAILAVVFRQNISMGLIQVRVKANVRAIERLLEPFKATTSPRSKFEGRELTEIPPGGLRLPLYS